MFQNDEDKLKELIETAINMSIRLESEKRIFVNQNR